MHPSPQVPDTAAWACVSVHVSACTLALLRSSRNSHMPTQTPPGRFSAEARRARKRKRPPHPPPTRMAQKSALSRAVDGETRHHTKRHYLAPWCGRAAKTPYGFCLAIADPENVSAAEWLSGAAAPDIVFSARGMQLARSSPNSVTLC